MRYSEIISKTTPFIKQTPIVQPSVVTQNSRVGKLVAQIAASDAKLPATELEKVLAMQAYSNLKNCADKSYAERLRQQLVKSKAAAH